MISRGCGNPEWTSLRYVTKSLNHECFIDFIACVTSLPDPTSCDEEF